MKVLFAAILMLLFSINNLLAEIIITPQQWDFGIIDNSTLVQKEIAIKNSELKTVHLRLISTCSCLYVRPDKLNLSGGETRNIQLKYEPFEDSGEVRMMVIVISELDKDVKRYFFNISGIVDSSISAKPEKEFKEETIKQDDAVWFNYYYDHGCRGCVIFLSKIMYKLQDEMDIKLRVVERDIRDPDVYVEYIDKTAGLKVEERGFPALIIDNVVLHGKDEIERRFGEVLKQYLQN
ncbi:hypothetical protein ES708_09962 [subsurface metagenome]